MQRHMLAHTRDRLGKTLAFDGLDQVVDGVHLERVERELAVGGDEHDGGRELEVLQRVGELQAGRLGHVDVEEHHVARIFLQLFDGLAHAGSLGDHFGLAQLVEKESQFGTRRGLVIDDHRFKHGNLLVPYPTLV